MSNTRRYYHLDLLSYFILIKNIAHSTKVKKEAREGNPEGGGGGGRREGGPGPDQAPAQSNTTFLIPSTQSNQWEIT